MSKIGNRVDSSPRRPVVRFNLTTHPSDIEKLGLKNEVQPRQLVHMLMEILRSWNSQFETSRITPSSASRGE